MLQSHWSELNRRPLDYESSALPLSYSGNAAARLLYGADRDRTGDLCSAIAALSQLSYSPVAPSWAPHILIDKDKRNRIRLRMGATGLEPVTSTMST